MPPLVPQTLQIPLAAGLSGKTDDRAKQPPALDIARDIQFDEVGGLQTRLPFSAMSMNILGGGTIANPRRIVAHGDELLLFTQTSLYSWSARDSAWVLKAEHLACKVTEDTRFARAADQVGCDRAELNNTVFVCWTGTDVTASLVYLAAYDKSTGAVLLSPTAVDGAQAGAAPRLVALSTTMLFVWQRNIATGIVGITIDPANIATSIAATPTLIINQAAIKPYDIVKIPGADAAIIAAALSPATSFSVVKVTSALALSSVTRARTCDGPIAVSVDPTGTKAQIVRANGANIQGDLLVVSSLADFFTAQPIGTATGIVGHIAVAHRSVQNAGQNRAYVFWSASESTGSGVNWTSKWNWIDTGNTHGTEANFVRLLGIASRAFDYNGQVYVWGVFAGATSASAAGFVSQLQNSYFLYRDDAQLITKAAFNSAGGFPATFTLPGVVVDPSSPTTFRFCGTVRRIVPIGNNSASLGYAERAPRDIAVTFDSDDSRRCARLGNTLYVAGGELLQYDGTGLYEVGFHVYPWALGVTVAAPGTILAGSYAYKSTWKWPNARGDVDRSTTATVVSGTAPGASGFDVTVNPLYTTRKTAQPPACEVWRTLINPNPDSPFYLVSSGDPSVLSGSNKYIANDPTVFPLPTFHDALADSSLASLQSNPENENVLEALAPPGASIILASDTRIFLAGVAGDPDRVWYSKQRQAFEVAAFHDALVIDVPRPGGSITALAFLNETLIVFRQYAIYAFAGDGLDNFGAGSNYGPGRILSLDVGAVSHESVALAPMGLVFKSAKGWMLLNRGWSVDDISDNASDFDGDTVKQIHVVDSTSQIRIMTDQRLVIWDYRSKVNQWGEWTIAGALGATVWNGLHVYCTSTTVMLEQTTFAAVAYGQDVETAWIKLNDLQGFGRVWEILALGEYRGPSFIVRMRVAYDYESDGAGGPAYVDDLPWQVSPLTVGGPLQVKHTPSRQQCQAIKVRLTATTEQFRAALLTALLATPVQCITGGNWNAGLAPWEPYVGERGNIVTLSIGFDLITSGTYTIDVRDHMRWDQTNQRWTESANNVGVRVQLGPFSAPTVGALESVINTSRIAFVASSDASPTKVINQTPMKGHTSSGTFSSGTYQAPNGECMKLSGLALRVGVRSGILNKRLPVGQRI